MNKKMPRTPFSTHLSGSARETEVRLRNIFSGPKKRPPALFLALVFSLCVFCGNLVSCQNAEAESPLPAEVWVDNWTASGEDSAEIELHEYPGVVFRWTADSVSAVKDGETVELFGGMPIWNVFLCDLNGDGLREFCATVSFGSGMIDDHIVVYDYDAGMAYTLWDRGIYDYTLSLHNGQLQVTRSEYTGLAVSVGGLALTEDGRLVMTGNVPGEATPEARAVTLDPGYSPQSEDEQWLLQTLFEAADGEEPFQFPAARLLACVEDSGRLLGAAYVTDHLENTLLLGVMDTETKELDGPVFRCSLPNGVPNVVKYRNQGTGYLLYTFNGQMMGQHLGQAGLVRFDSNGPVWEWPVYGDVREADSSAQREYQDYWTGHLALMAPGGVDIYETDPDFVWGDDASPSMWRVEHNQYFYRADEADLPMPVYFQSLMWLNETTGDPGGWRITALLPNERFPVPGEGWDSFTLLAQSDDNRQYLAANLVFPYYEEENGRRSYGSLDHAAAYDMGAPGADIRLGDDWDQVRAVFPDLREDGYPAGWDSYLWYCSGDPQTAPAYVFLFENDVLVDIALRPPLGGN